MTGRKGLFIAGTGAALLIAGCTLRSVSFHANADHPPGRVVHAHSHSCGHYYDGGGWVVIARGHAHGPGCGHYYSDHGWVLTGRTVLVDPSPRRRVVEVEECHHHRGCPHVFSDGVWISISAGHRHGPDCGHRFLDGRWVMVRGSSVDHHDGPTRRVRVGHTHDARCGCVWNRSRWITIGGGHVHGPRCGHVYIEGRWSIR